MEIDLILERVKKYLNTKNDKDIARLLGISANDFSNRKRRKTLLPVILEWATNEKVSLDWIVYGDENKGTENFNSSLAPEHLILITAYETAEEPIKEAALTMLKNSSKKLKSTDQKG